MNISFGKALALESKGTGAAGAVAVALHGLGLEYTDSLAWIIAAALTVATLSVFFMQGRYSFSFRLITAIKSTFIGLVMAACVLYYLSLQEWPTLPEVIVGCLFFLSVYFGNPAAEAVRAGLIGLRKALRKGSGADKLMGGDGDVKDDSEETQSGMAFSKKK